ncbi:hypothetical protein TNCV_3085891 [Trichonephila clavipes]|nr:hypothetical protein TNCV_3085891 [Trichonephila clavipes]
MGWALATPPLQTRQVPKFAGSIPSAPLKTSRVEVLVSPTDLLRLKSSRWYGEEVWRWGAISAMPHGRHRASFEQVTELDRGRIVAYRDYGISFREMGQRVGRKQATVVRICHRWMQKEMTDRLG